MRILTFLFLTIIPFLTYSQYYKESQITEEEGLLKDETMDLHLDPTSGILYAAHKNGVSKIFGSSVQAIPIPEYDGLGKVPDFQIVNDELYFYRHNISNEEQAPTVFPYGHRLVQTTITDYGRDTLKRSFEAIRDSKGNFWMNILDEEGEYQLIKIVGSDTIRLELPFKHKVNFSAYFKSYYSVTKRSQIFSEYYGYMWIISENNQLVKINIETNEIELTEIYINNLYDLHITKNKDILISSYADDEIDHQVQLYRDKQLIYEKKFESYVLLWNGLDSIVHVADGPNLYALEQDRLNLIHSTELNIQSHSYDSMGNHYVWCTDSSFYSYVIKIGKERKDTLFTTDAEVNDFKVNKDGIVWIALQDGIKKLEPSSIEESPYAFADRIPSSNYLFYTKNATGWQFFNTNRSFGYNPDKDELNLFDLDRDYLIFDRFRTPSGSTYLHFYDYNSPEEEMYEQFAEVNDDGSLRILSKKGLDPYNYLLNNDYYGCLYGEQFYLTSSYGVYRNTNDGFVKYGLPLDTSQELSVSPVPGFAHFTLYHLVKNYLDDKNREVVDSKLFNFISNEYEDPDWGIDSISIDYIYGGQGLDFIGKLKNSDQILNRFQGESSLVDIPISSINDSVIGHYNPGFRWLLRPLVDPEGNYYFMAGIHGLLCFFPEKNEFLQLTKADGLVGNKIGKSFFDQDSSQLYIMAHEGMQALDLEELRRGNLKETLFFSRQEGIRSLTNSQWRDDSTLIVHKSQSFLTIRLKGTKKPSPNIVFQNIRIGDEEIDWREFPNELSKDGMLSYPKTITIPFESNRILFEFQAIDHFSVSEANYAFQLIGIDQKKITSNHGESIYQNIPPGDYLFEVQTINREGLESRTLQIKLIVLRPFYQKAWFILLCIFSLSLILYGLYRWRIQALKRKQEVLEGLVKEKTIQLQEEKDFALEQKEIIEEKNKEITDSISYSKRLQDSILPPLEDIESALPNSFVSFLPKDIVSGDFYWFEEVGETKFIACADCTGHGVPGAMVSLVCANALNRVVNEFKIYEPSKILDAARKLIVRTFHKSGTDVKDGMDISLCAIKGNQLSYAGAYNPLLVIRNKDQKIPETNSIKALEHDQNKHLFEIKGDKQAVGLMDEMNNFTQHELKLCEGDSIYMYSDGIVDQFGGENGKKLKAPNFRKVLLSIQNFDMKEQKERLEEDFIKWKGELDQIDDVCVIGVRI